MYLRIFLIFLLSIVISISTIAPLWFYLIFINYICIEYIILLGGFLLWLNTKKEEYFEETSILRNMIGVDGRIVLGSCVLFTFFCVTRLSLEFPFSKIVFVNDNFFILFLLLKLFVCLFLVVALHSMLVGERLVGVAFIYYPPLCKLVKTVTSFLKIKDANSRLGRKG